MLMVCAAEGAVCLPLPWSSLLVADEPEELLRPGRAEQEPTASFWGFFSIEVTNSVVVAPPPLPRGKEGVCWQPLLRVLLSGTGRRAGSSADKHTEPGNCLRVRVIKQAKLLEKLLRGSSQGKLTVLWTVNAVGALINVGCLSVHLCH